MLSGNFGLNRLLTSNALTVAIVGSIILINSVAWGIPLIVGSRDSSPALDGSGINTGTVPNVTKPNKTRPARAVKTVLTMHRLLVPLPTRAPTMSTPETKNTRVSAATKNTIATAPQTPLKNRAPTTLFPRPEAAPVILSGRTPFASRDRAGVGKVGIEPDSTRKPARDVVFVSPYTPGVRVMPNGRSHEWRHRNLRADRSPTTLDTAKAIARRAAKRFEQMRDRMAKLDARDAVLSKQESVRRHALMPVAPRPPRVVDGGTGRSVAKSAYSYVRPRLVRRPLGGVAAQRPTKSTRALSRAMTRQSRIITRRGTGRPSSKSPSRSVRVARVEPSAGRAASNRRAQVKRRKATAKASLARAIRAARKRRRRKVRRIAARARAIRISRSRARRGCCYARRSRKVDGFRRGFHRQLVSANFFNTGN